MSSPAYRIELEASTQPTPDIVREIVSAITNWLRALANSSAASGDSNPGSIILCTSNVKVFLRYDERSQRCVVRYKSRWLSGAASRRCRQLTMGAEMTIGFTEDLLLRLSSASASQFEFWTRSAHEILVGAIDHIRSNPAACQMRRVSRCLYELRETNLFHLKARIRIKGQNHILIEDIAFLPSVAGSLVQS